MLSVRSGIEQSWVYIWAGITLIYMTHELDADFTDTTSGRYCNHRLYNMATCTALLLFILAAIAVCVKCCCLIVKNSRHDDGSKETECLAEVFVETVFGACWYLDWFTSTWERIFILKYAYALIIFRFSPNIMNLLNSLVVVWFEWSSLVNTIGIRILDKFYSQSHFVLSLLCSRNVVNSFWIHLVK
jgi:hypothetical protein